jgi:NAD(P)-dependent dehydrogenase (short-subunit alcohol dehydrogenase family)
LSAADATHSPLEKHLANAECNALSAVAVTHLFVTRMLAKKLRGCVVFTSSAAACQPGPFSSMYGATKAFLSSFGASIAVELRSRGIDVTVVHPSPVASRFYDNAHKLDAIAFFNKRVHAPPCSLSCAELTMPRQVQRAARGAAGPDLRERGPLRVARHRRCGGGLQNAHEARGAWLVMHLRRSADAAGPHRTST